MTVTFAHIITLLKQALWMEWVLEDVAHLSSFVSWLIPFPVVLGPKCNPPPFSTMKYISLCMVYFNVTLQGGAQVLMLW